MRRARGLPTASLSQETPGTVWLAARAPCSRLRQTGFSRSWGGGWGRPLWGFMSRSKYRILFRAQPLKACATYP